MSDVLGPQSLAAFVPGTKMKLWACGFEIVCEFVPGFVPNAYARTHGGIRRQGGQIDNQTRPNWNVATANELERVGVTGQRQRNTNQQVEAPHVPVRGFFFAKFGAEVAQQDEAPDSVAPLFGKVVLEMARDSFYSEVSVSPYKRDGKQVGWKGTLRYHDMGELDAFGKPKRKTTSKTTLTKGKIAATAELKQWREARGGRRRCPGRRRPRRARCPEARRDGQGVGGDAYEAGLRGDFRGGVSRLEA